jgi:phytase-like protein
MNRLSLRALPISALLALTPSCTKSTGEPNAAASARAAASSRAPVLAAPLELVLERALPIEITEDFEPSGLLLWETHLLTVSDKHDDAVFELIPGAEAASVRPFLRFDPPPAEPRPFDFEGLCAASDGALLLVSEARYRVLRVTRQGDAAWVTPSLQALGLEAGLFRKRNAALEGITRLGDGRILLAAEREPRGLLELPKAQDTREALAWALPDSIYPTPNGRSPDFSDLTSFAGNVYALERNSHLIVRLERAADQWLEREAWSYARTENDPRFAYENGNFGLAEGVAIDETHVFLVFDNNRDRRATNTNDRRPLLFVFKRPS